MQLRKDGVRRRPTPTRGDADSVAKRLTAQFRRYARTWLWIARDVIALFSWRVLAVLGVSVVGLGAALTAVYGVMAYVRHAEQGTPMRVAGVTLDVSSTMRPLLIVAAAVGALGILSATCTYLTDRMVLTMARRYQRTCGERVLRLAADPRTRGWQALERDPPRVMLTRLIGASSRAMGLTGRDMLRMILPMLTFLAAIGVLCAVNGRLTLALVPLALAYLGPLYLINRRVARLQRQYRHSVPAARLEISRQLRDALDDGELSARCATIECEALNGPNATAAFAALYGRMLADRRVHLLNAAFFITCLAVLLVVFGSQAREARGGGIWAELVVYLFALRFAITSLRQVTAFLAKFSRFYGETHRYERFVRVAEESRSRRCREADPIAASLPDSVTVRLERHPLWDSSRVVNVSTRGVLWILTPLASGHADLEAAVVRLEHRLREPDVDLSRAASFISRAGPQQASPSRVVVLSANAREPMAAAALAAETASFRIIVTDDVARALRARIESTVSFLVLDQGQFVGGGDAAWLAHHAAAIKQHLVAARRALRGRPLDDDRADEDDEDEL